ncbi:MULTISPECIES: hypothetical protein [Bacillaceae]|uniref:Uncharacterized protein n=1 Tax=Evansella alkalicola TaxID=745819 RepID=A0ABS6JTL0_9BACI|nr:MULTISPECIES: hypothetical protein [Bacillaceae]MBU9720582.1 hypothetical protein [Bacillus alkalicola]
MRNNLGTFLKLMGYLAILVGTVAAIYIYYAVQGANSIEWGLHLSFMWVYMSFLSGLLLIGMAFIITHLSKGYSKSYGKNKENMTKQKETVQRNKSESQKEKVTDKLKSSDGTISVIGMSRKERLEQEKMGRKSKKSKGKEYIKSSKKKEDQVVKQPKKVKLPKEIKAAGKSDIKIDENKEVPFEEYLSLSRYCQKHYKRKPQTIKATNLANHFYIVITPKKGKLVKKVNQVIVEVK